MQHADFHAVQFTWTERIGDNTTLPCSAVLHRRKLVCGFTAFPHEHLPHTTNNGNESDRLLFAYMFLGLHLMRYTISSQRRECYWRIVSTAFKLYLVRLDF
jgi:hypothetical protein